MGLMIAKMTAAMLTYVAITAVVWHFWQKSNKGLPLQAIIGVLYGLCAVASTHFGVDYRQMIVNVRDLGPLIAGLFYSPFSGILAGLIGGIERYIAGTYWGVGSYTRLACSLSTCLAGFFAAFLNRLVQNGKHPPVLQAFFIGSVMEVFHMYAILISHRNSMRIAFSIVQNCSVPMILFSGVGLALCAFVVLRMSGEFRWELNLLPKEQTPIAYRFQRWLFLVTFLVFAADFAMEFHFQTRIAYQDAVSSLSSMSAKYRSFYSKVQEETDPLGLLETYDSVDIHSICIVFDREGNIAADSLHPETQAPNLSEHDFVYLQEQLEKLPFTVSLDYCENREIVGLTRKLDDTYLLMVGRYADEIYENRAEQMYENTLSAILLFGAMYIMIYLLSETLIVSSLRSVNTTLSKIIDGNLEETVSARGSLEFAQLSDDINETVHTLKGYIKRAEKQMEYELQLAATIQESAIPRTFTFPRDDFEIYALMDLAKQVGGDFYDFFFIDADRLALVIADVSGKGIPAALFMMRSKTAIANMARSGSSPAELLQNVNDILCEGNEAEMFVTVWVGIIDLTDGRMLCANAGHEYPVIMRAGGDYELFKDRHGIALAAIEDTMPKEYELQFNPGDRLFVYTDGVPEAVNEANEQYGVGRLTDELNSLKEGTQEEILKGVLEDITQFSGKADQFDDITMLGFTYFGPDSNTENGRAQSVVSEKGDVDVTGKSKELPEEEGLS